MLLARLLSVAPLVLAAAAAAAAAGSGCAATEPPVALNERHRATLAGTNRTYMYFLPGGYNASQGNPLILSFHGAGRTSEWQADLDRLTDPFFNRDHVVVYPQAERYGPTDDFIYWQGAPNATADDVGFAGAVLDELEARLCVDAARVYATGKSQGGGLVGRLACDGTGVGARVAAFAPVSGAFYTGAGEAGCAGVAAAENVTCSPSRARVPLLDFHGGNDTTINILGGPRNGGCLPDIRTYVAEWVARDGLVAAAANATAGAAVQALAGTAQVTRYGSESGGDDAGLVTFVYDGDRVNHDWPATFNNSDNWSHQSGPAAFNASSMIMEFFANYTL